MTKKKVKDAIIIEKKQPQKQEMSPMVMIDRAIEKNVSIEVMERLFVLQEKWDAKMAKKAFDEAMSAFQGECPIIKKEKDGGETKQGLRAYKYAPLEAIIEKVKPILAKHGLSYSFDVTVNGQNVTAICIAKHILGHSEQSTMEVPLGTKTGIMSNSQVTAGTSTFAKRYAFVNIFGIVTEDEDNEKNLEKTSSAPQIQDPSQAQVLIDSIIQIAKETKQPLDKYLSHFHVDNLTQLDSLRLQMIEKTLKEKGKIV
jgi:hypothetical protein